MLNTAEGSRYGQVDTGHAYYRDMPNIRYMGFPMTDQPSTDISRYFYIAAKFIDNAISSGGKIILYIRLAVFYIIGFLIFVQLVERHQRNAIIFIRCVLS